MIIVFVFKISPYVSSLSSFAQTLDPESAAGMARIEVKDAQIDQGLDALGRSIDNIHSISNAMKQEVSLCLNLKCLVEIT